MTRSVMIATPSHDGRLDVPYVQSLLASREVLRGENIDTKLSVVSGTPVVPARNLLFHKFLHSDHTDMMFIDADVGWGVNAISRLLSHDLPLVAAVVCLKNNLHKFTVSTPTGLIDRDNMLVGVAEAGTAFMRIRRDCAQAMAERYSAVVSARREGLPVIGVFNQILTSDELLGEDYSFCQRWSAIGGKIWVDASIRLDHWGTKAYSADPSVLMNVRAITGPPVAH